MDVKNIVDRLYPGDWRDRFIPVSQYEHKQQVLRIKVEIANLYLEKYRMSQAMEDADITLSPLEGQEDEVYHMVEEDELAFDMDMEKNTYDRRVKAFEEQSLVEAIRRLLMGEPVDPYDPPEEFEEVEPYSPENSKEAKRIYMAGQARKEKEKAEASIAKRKESKGEGQAKDKKEAWLFKRKKKRDVSADEEKEVDALIQRIDTDLYNLKENGGIDKTSKDDLLTLEEAIEDVQAYLT